MCLFFIAKPFQPFWVGTHVQGEPDACPPRDQQWPYIVAHTTTSYNELLIIFKDEIINNLTIFLYGYLIIQQ